MRKPPDWLGKSYAMRAMRWLMEVQVCRQAEFTAMYNQSRRYPGRETEMVLVNRQVWDHSRSRSVKKELLQTLSKPSLSFAREFSRFIKKMNDLDTEDEEPLVSQIEEQLCPQCRGGIEVFEDAPPRVGGCPRCQGVGVVQVRLTHEEIAQRTEERRVRDLWRVIERRGLGNVRFHLRWLGPSVDAYLASLTVTDRERGYMAMEWCMQQKTHAHDTEHYARWALWARNGRR